MVGWVMVMMKYVRDVSSVVCMLEQGRGQADGWNILPPPLLPVCDGVSLLALIVVFVVHYLLVLLGAWK